MKFKIEVGIDDIKKLPFWRAVAAEFLGCVLFLLCVTTVALSWKSGASTINASANNVEIGIGVGLAISTLAYMFGDVSGGHLNPAVSLAMVTGGRIPILKGVMYIIAQLAGGIVGSALTYGLTNKSSRETLAVTTLGPGVTEAQGFGLELLFTFLFVFYIFSATDPVRKAKPINAALGIGLALLVCHVCIIPFTGCSLNPARSFGPAVVTDKWKYQWVYWIGPLIGGVLASVFYTFIFFAEKEKDPIQHARSINSTTSFVCRNCSYNNPASLDAYGVTINESVREIIHKENTEN